MTPPNARALWNLGYSVVRIAQELTRAEGCEVSVGDVCHRLWREGISTRPKGQALKAAAQPRRQMGKRPRFGTGTDNA